MGKGYNNYMCKKPFHPGSKANIKRAWMAEQKTENEKKKQDELKVQYEKEQDLYNNRALISTESKDKLQLNFMYEAPPGAKRERQKEDDEPEYRFEWQRKYNAPREDYAKGNADIKDQPFGIPVRNVRCIKCHKWGHINTDRECPMFSQASTSSMPSTSMDPLELMRQMREDGYGLKQNVLGHQLNPKASNQQLLPSDESDPEMEFLKSLSSKQKKKLLRKLNKLSKKQKRNAKGKKEKKNRKHKDSSASDSDAEESKKSKKDSSSSEDSSSEDEAEQKKSSKKSKKRARSKTKKSHKNKDTSDDESDSEKDRTNSSEKKKRTSNGSKVKSEKDKTDSQKRKARTKQAEQLEDKHKRKRPRDASTESNSSREESKPSSGQGKTKSGDDSRSSEKVTHRNIKKEENDLKHRKDIKSRDSSTETNSSTEESKPRSRQSKTNGGDNSRSSEKIKHKKIKSEVIDVKTNTKPPKDSLREKSDSKREVKSERKEELIDGGDNSRSSEKPAHNKVKSEVIDEKLDTKPPKDSLPEKSDSKREVKSERKEELIDKDHVPETKKLSSTEIGSVKSIKHPDGYDQLCPQAVVDSNYLPATEEYEGQPHDRFRDFHRHRRSPSVKQKYK